MAYFIATTKMTEQIFFFFFNDTFSHQAFQ